MIVLSCGCTSTATGNRSGALYQDARFGKGNRAHTMTAKDTPKTFRCTVCSHERTKPGPVESAKQKKAKDEDETKKSGRKFASTKK